MDIPSSAFALPAAVVPTTATPPTTTPTMMMMDASYDFGYTADQSSRAESADPSGNVVGTYAYTSPDGNQLVVRKQPFIQLSVARLACVI